VSNPWPDGTLSHCLPFVRYTYFTFTIFRTSSLLLYMEERFVPFFVKQWSSSGYDMCMNVLPTLACTCMIKCSWDINYGKCKSMWVHPHVITSLSSIQSSVSPHSSTSSACTPITGTLSWVLLWWLAFGLMANWCTLQAFMLCFFITHCSLRLIVRSELDVSNFATRRLHAFHHARAPSGRRWNCGREMSGNFVKMPTYTLYLWNFNMP